MNEYRITRQAVDTDEKWQPVPGAPVRELELHPPAGDDWSLHSFEHGPTQVVAVWTRSKRPHAMSGVYSHPDPQTTDGRPSPIKTVADIPTPK